MKYPYDLHIHSNCSDGDYLPEELVKIAKENKMQGVVLTDHNTIFGLDRFIDEAKKAKITTLEGVEISTKYNRTDIHIIGYSHKFERKKLINGLTKTVKGYNQRAQKMVNKVVDNKIASITFKEIQNKKPSKYCPVMNYNISSEIMGKTGMSLSEASKFVTRGGIAYVPYGDWAMDPFEAASLIIKSNGIAILAHPGEFFSAKRSYDSNNNMESLVDLIIKLKKIGVCGLECRYSKHTSTQELEFIDIAKKYKLLISGGTDYHGLIHKPDIFMGTSGVNKDEFDKLVLQINKKRTG